MTQTQLETHVRNFIETLENFSTVYGELTDSDLIQMAKKIREHFFNDEGDDRLDICDEAGAILNMATGFRLCRFCKRPVSIGEETSPKFCPGCEMSCRILTVVPEPA